MRKFLFIIMALMLIGSVSAIPGVPHKFYGDVTTNGQAAPDGTFVEARIKDGAIDKIYAVAATKNGKYGYSPEFLVADKDGTFSGKTITFFVADVQAAVAFRATRLTSLKSPQARVAAEAVGAAAAQSSSKMTKRLMRTATVQPRQKRLLSLIASSLSWPRPASLTGNAPRGLRASITRGCAPAST